MSDVQFTRTREPLPITILTKSDVGETFPGPYVDIYIGEEPYTVTPLIDLAEFTSMLDDCGLEYDVRHTTF